MSILQILLALPKLIQAVEALFHAFPGKGQVKKDLVQGAIGSAIDVAQSVGVKIDKSYTLGITSALTDDYVAVTNASHAWESGG